MVINNSKQQYITELLSLALMDNFKQIAPINQEWGGTLGASPQRKLHAQRWVFHERLMEEGVKEARLVIQGS